MIKIPAICSAVLLILTWSMVSIGCSKTGEEKRPPEIEKTPIKDQAKQKQVKHYSIEQFMDIVSIRDRAFSYDESKIFFSSNRTGIYNIYAVPVKGGEPQQLTHSARESFYLESAFPGDNRILFRADSGGNEIDHLFLREEDGTIKDLTPQPEARSSFLEWSRDLKSFFFSSNKRDPKFMDLYEMDIASFTPRLFFKNEKGFESFKISDNKRYIAMVKVDTDHNTDIYLFDREKSELKNITVHEGEVRNTPQGFEVNGKFYYLTDENSEFRYVKSYDPASGKSETVVQKNWPIRKVDFSRQGTYRVISINNDGRTEVEIFAARSQKNVEIPAFPGANITSLLISKSEERMVFYLDSSTSPDNLYVYDLKTGEYRKLTESLNPEIDQKDLVEAKVIRYKSFDGLEIPAIFYVPKHIKEGEKIAALLWIHGGPGGQSRVGYQDLIQYLVNHGYAILAVNNRGSSGYGKTFYKLDDRRHGEDDLADCVEAKKFLAATGLVDENKIGIIGGSYGGYMVLAALAFRPEEFAVGVDVFGVANWVRTLKSIPPWWESYRKALYTELGNPGTDEEYLKKISPLFHAHKINKPLIVLQGANDPRVLQVESDEIVAVVKKKGIPVEYIVFPDEGHGFKKKNNKITSNKAILKFLDKYLKGKEEVYIY
jgi:dipeptidyl aminopeptidase/acylaminoacyl peptidase